MRIALYHNLPSGGAMRVVFEHCRLLTEAGHQVVVYQPDTADQGFLDVTPVVARVVRVPFYWRERPVRSGLRRLPDALVGATSLLAGHLRLTALQARLAAEIDAARYDLLYVHHDRFETAPSLLRFARTPTVYYCQEPSRALFEAPLTEGRSRPAVPPSGPQLWRQALPGKPFRRWLQGYRLINERLNTGAATVVLANSHYSAESILRAHGRPARLCRLGVDVETFTPGGARGDYVLSVGAYHVTKGFRFLVRALGRVPAAERPRLVLCGDRGEGPEKAHLEQLAEAHGVTLEMRQRVSDEELCGLYRGARLFLYAPYLEPLGLAPLEAMACGTPVLGVQEAGVRETVVPGRGGRLVGRDERQFAAALREMLSDPAGLEEAGRQGREYVCREWTWARSLESLLAAFAEALAPAEE
jgi:glycosyltransferase involved in cell wall biosynthesis